MSRFLIKQFSITMRTTRINEGFLYRNSLVEKDECLSCRLTKHTNGGKRRYQPASPKTTRWPSDRFKRRNVSSICYPSKSTISALQHPWGRVPSDGTSTTYAYCPSRYGSTTPKGSNSGSTPSPQLGSSRRRRRSEKTKSLKCQ